MRLNNRHWIDNQILTVYFTTTEIKCIIYYITNFFVESVVLFCHLDLYYNISYMRILKIQIKISK